MPDIQQIFFWGGGLGKQATCLPLGMYEWVCSRNLFKMSSSPFTKHPVVGTFRKAELLWGKEATTARPLKPITANSEMGRNIILLIFHIKLVLYNPNANISKVTNWILTCMKFVSRQHFAKLLPYRLIRAKTLCTLGRHRDEDIFVVC